MRAQRINRIIGQLKGIERMTETKRDCREILQQVSAVKKAIDGLSKELVIEQMGGFVPKDKEKEFERMIAGILSI